MTRRLRPYNLDRWDFLLATLTGTALGWLSGFWSFSGLHPAVWKPVCTAIGIYPPETLSPSLWSSLVRALYQWLPAVQASSVLHLAGNVALGLFAFLMYFLVQETLPSILAERMRRFSVTRKVVRALCLMGTVLFCCSDPVWRLGQTFSPTTLLVLVLLLCGWVFCRFLRTGHSGAVCSVSFVLGAVAVDSLAGFAAMLLVCIATVMHSLEQVENGGNLFTCPWAVSRALVVTQLFFAAGFLVHLAWASYAFVQAGGPEAMNRTAIDWLSHHLFGYWVGLRETASWCGWLFVLIVVCIPPVHVLAFILRGINDERFLNICYLLLYGGLAICGLSQVCGCAPLWFWMWAPGTIVVNDDLLLAVCMFVCTLTAVLSMGVVGIDVYYRDYRRLAEICYGDEPRQSSESLRILASFRPMAHVLRLSLRVFPVLIVTACILAVRQADVRRMSEVLQAYCHETVRECAEADLLVTDGVLDAGVMLAAREMGSPVRTVSLMGGFRPIEIALRRRAVTDPAEADLLERGVVVALREWIEKNDPRLARVVVQLGLEIWKRSNRKPPVSSGLLAGEGLRDQAEIARGRDVAERLAQEILSIYSKGTVDGEADSAILNAFRVVQWRVARMSRMRAEEIEAKGAVEAALEETRQADDLDAHNGTLQRMQKKSAARIVDRRGRILQAREGLWLGLSRADFSLAGSYARQVLVYDAEDTAANFALGMENMQAEEYAEAEVYFKRCLIRRPNEPAALNNLALVELRMGRLSLAEAHAREALKLLPDSEDVQQTLKSILTAQTTAGKPSL